MRRIGAITGLILAAVLITPSASTALEGPRAEYRSRVEPICKAEGEAKERIAGSGERKQAQSPDALRQTGRRLVKDADALGKALAKLRAVPRPEVDSALLARWLNMISNQVTLLHKAGNAAIDGHGGRAQKLVNQFTGGSRKANNLVVSYEFRHCVFEEAGFTS